MPRKKIITKLRYSKMVLILGSPTAVFLRRVTLKSAEAKMIVLIPRLITSAERNPNTYSPIDKEKIKTVTVPGQGTIPAEMISAASVEL